MSKNPTTKTVRHPLAKHPIPCGGRTICCGGTGGGGGGGRGGGKFTQIEKYFAGHSDSSFRFRRTPRLLAAFASAMVSPLAAKSIAVYFFDQDL
jgi:hypothetical protein